MRVVYLGTPEFAVNPLKKLIESDLCTIVGVVTNKDKPVGRKKIMTAPPVKLFAEERGIPVYQYDKIRVEGVEDLKSLNPDLIITCAFGQILSQEIIDVPKFGVINIHASLLPKYRGASPIHFAILNGETETGITVMRTDAGIDTGDVILQEKIAINKGETCGELFDRLSNVGADLIIKVLPLIKNKSVKFIKQDESVATYTGIIKKEMAEIDWNKSAQFIYNQVRAFNPSPIAFTTYKNEPFKVYESEVVELNGNPGEILCADKNLIIACGEKAISLKVVQKAGGKPMAIGDFLRGAKISVGELFN